MSRRVGVRRTCDALKTQHRCPKASLPEGIAAEKSTWQKFQRPRSSLHCAQRPSDSYSSHGQGEFKKKILIQTHLISHSSSIHSPHIIHSPRSQTPIDGPWRRISRRLGRSAQFAATPPCLPRIANCDSSSVIHRPGRPPRLGLVRVHLDASPRGRPSTSRPVAVVHGRRVAVDPGRGFWGISRIGTDAEPWPSHPRAPARSRQKMPDSVRPAVRGPNRAVMKPDRAPRATSQRAEARSRPRGCWGALSRA